MTPDSKSRTVEEIRDALQDALESASEAGYWLKAGIEDMRREEIRDRDEFANIVRDGIDELARLREDVERFKEALEPFAALGRVVGPRFDPRKKIYGITTADDSAEITVGHLRVAAQTFAALQPQPEDPKP